MAKRTGNPGIVIALPYAEENKINNIPPKEKFKSSDLKRRFMTQELLADMEAQHEIMTIGKAIENSKKIDIAVHNAKRNGIEEIPAGAITGATKANTAIKPDEIGNKVDFGR